jgi:hypothetical protein
MQVVGEGSPCHDIFKVDSDLSCVDQVAVDFHADKRSLIAWKSFIRELIIYAICVGASHNFECGKVDIVMFMPTCFLFAILARSKVLRLWSVAPIITAKQFIKAITGNIAGKRR